MLPSDVRAIHAALKLHGLSAREERFFTDQRLAGFWSAAGEALRQARLDQRLIAAHQLVATFLDPLKWLADDGERPEKSDKKPERRRRMLEQKERLRLAAEKARELADLLNEIAKGPEPPDMSVLYFSEAVLPLPEEQRPSWNLPSYYLGFRVTDALEAFAEKLDAQAAEPLPVWLESQKASWRDWVRQVRWHLRQLDDFGLLHFEPREADWVALAQVLFDEWISRDAVHDALRTCNPGW
jgi:hypothetical protein